MLVPLIRDSLLWGKRLLLTKTCSACFGFLTCPTFGLCWGPGSASHSLGLLVFSGRKAGRGDKGMLGCSHRAGGAPLATGNARPSGGIPH